MSREKTTAAFTKDELDILSRGLNIPVDDPEFIETGLLDYIKKAHKSRIHSSNEPLPDNVKCVSKFLQLFRDSKNSKCLSIGHNLLDDSLVQVFTELLRKNTNLKELSFYLVGEKDIEIMNKLIEILKGNHTVKTLILTQTTNRIASLDIKPLANILRDNNTALKNLSLNYTWITRESFKLLAEALSVNETLKTLNLSNNKITSEDINILAEFLKINNTLEVLYLSDNKITNEGAQILAEALKINKALEMLDLSSNKITSEGIKVLAKALRKNDTLKILELHNTAASKTLFTAGLFGTSGTKRIPSYMGTCGRTAKRGVSDKVCK